MAKIIFLGTAGTSAVMSKQLRASGGIILQVGDLQFHLDPGPGALAKAREYGVNLHNTTGILVSHNHFNHCNDLNVAIEAMTHSGLEQRGVVLGSKSLFLGSESCPPIVTSHHQGLVEKVIPLEKNHKVAVELIEVDSFPAEHQDSSAVGFKFFCPRFTLAYSGDTKWYPGLAQEMKGADILILNVPYPGKKGAGLNLDTDSALKIVTEVRPQFVILTHFGLEMLKADPINEAREIQRATGIPTIAAKDGLVVDPDSYGQNKSNVRGYPREY